MQIYCVGGAIRDELLGLPVKDRDWVVVGATPDEMLALGYQPVGRDFPVFLHPKTHEEYALARTERKTAPGYAGFVFHTDPGVTLEDDLARRDLTINAIARAPDGSLIDPHGGQRDLAARILRHVAPAFAEDPVRILRVARFAARFNDFSLAPETLVLMQQMVANGEVDALVAERVWQELANGLMEAQPSRMFETLRACGALQRLLPELDRLWGVPQRADYHPEIDTGVHVMMVIDMAARLDLSLPARFAALTHDLGKGTTPAEILPRHAGHELRSVALLEPLCTRLRVPTDCRDVARLVARFHGDMYRVAELRPETKVKILERCDALRRPARFEEVLGACAADYRGRLGFAERDYAAADQWRQVLAAVQGVDAGAVARACEDPAQIPARVHEARVKAVAALVTSSTAP
ncbi:MAG: multifunctional CCA addition/repair protein [Gammaproteobacteria bacterium]|nr:multifunctional CCA addition/repair protein [Rhodocyclaceae bacterium]MBU3908024.1 multifunctional CCA addition/repair protein [Gammaproteobacteria bacterium]MBU3990594.1 multifunctional CCA addition/repair protein [Gammaproteobacteria bacterium]MBU4006045.1 multifunctional CCA addition/repair protein [Gammaproteobacteria bacterium]MBU4022046.1 multifunctional CCA addition/repair protein [Gammaproteobacteria bacterium]